jgi:hypothetical protein
MENYLYLFILESRMPCKLGCAFSSYLDAFFTTSSRQKKVTILLLGGSTGADIFIIVIRLYELAAFSSRGLLGLDAV